MEYSFNFFNKLAGDGEAIALKKFIPFSSYPPIILCIGSDLSVCDSLGPITGTKIKEKLGGANVYVYGTLAKPITAHEVKYINDFITKTHPNSPIIAIDAAVGNFGDIGLIKIVKHGISPGSGANKKLGKVGDVSIMGIVSEKGLFNYSLFSSTRLNMVYRMADIISDGVCSFIIDYVERVVKFG
jgi:putative sporulation protein YyaC